MRINLLLVTRIWLLWCDFLLKATATTQRLKRHCTKFSPRKEFAQWDLWNHIVALSSVATNQNEDLEALNWIAGQRNVPGCFCKIEIGISVVLESTHVNSDCCTCVAVVVAWSCDSYGVTPLMKLFWRRGKSRGTPSRGTMLVAWLPAASAAIWESTL